MPGHLPAFSGALRKPSHTMTRAHQPSRFTALGVNFSGMAAFCLRNSSNAFVWSSVHSLLIVLSLLGRMFRNAFVASSTCGVSSWTVRAIPLPPPTTTPGAKESAMLIWTAFEDPPSPWPHAY